MSAFYTTFSDRLNNSWLWDVEHFSEPNQEVALPCKPFSIHVVAVNNKGNTSDDGRPPNNHWLFYLEIPPLNGRRRSIAFSPRSGETSNHAGSIHLYYERKPYTARVARVLSSQFLVGITIEQIIEYMMQVLLRYLTTFDCR
jgi:hypothetical protein